MASYSLNPYAISAAPRYERAGERRPIADVDGSGLSFREVIETFLQALRGGTLHIDPDDGARGLRVADLRSGTGFVYAEVGIGRAGVEGTLHQRTGDSVTYGPDEHNESLVRSMFIFPRDGHEVFWLSERAGMTSGRTDLGARLMSTLRARVHEMTFKIEPVVAWSAVRAWADQTPVKEIKFDAPRAGDSQAMLANGLHGEVRISVKPHGSFKLDRLIGRDGPDSGMVFGFLRDVSVVQDNLTTDALIHAGWSASVSFDTPSGHQRSFGVGIDAEPPSLIYPVGPDQTGLRAPVRPTTLEFVDACSQFLNDARELSRNAPSVAGEILQAFSA